MDYVLVLYFGGLVEFMDQSLVYENVSLLFGGSAGI